MFVENEENEENEEVNSTQNFPINIKDEEGNLGVLMVSKQMTVKEVELKLIEKKEMKNITSIQFIYKGKPLKPEKTLEVYNISSGDMLHYNVRLRGGKYKQS